MNPRLIINLNKFRNNASMLCRQCHAHGISVAAVTKSYCADFRMMEVLSGLPVDYFADSRIENIQSYPPHNKQTILLRLPAPSEAARTVNACDISLNSELETIKRLSQAAALKNKCHGIILMVDVGDLREGIYYCNESLLYETIEYILSQDNLKLMGLGTNLTCYGSVIPTPTNLGYLCDIANQAEADFGIELPIISGGNSSSLYLLKENQIPQGINNLRLGEAMVRGIETAYSKTITDLDTDVITLEAEIIELQSKPSMPEGMIGKNAFGEVGKYTDKGHRVRGILAIGRQDTDYEGLLCLEPGVEIIGASSDHLIVDLTDAKSEFSVGGTMHFSMSYGAILQGFASKYVEKTYI